jgi:phosphate transport system substrate-binding protein
VIKRGVLAVGVLLALAAAGCGAVPAAPAPAAASPKPGAVVVHALGSEFAAPVYAEISDLFGGRSVVLNYQPTSDGWPHIESFPHNIAFLASQSMNPVGNLPHTSGTSGLYVPVVFGGDAVIYNLPGLRRPLRLRGSTLADIYLGRVTHWNSKEIAASNRGVKLPPTMITLVHLSSPSPLTQLFTSYLSATSARWRKGPGSGETINWPGGTAEADNTGMRQAIAETPGAIGYTDQASALQNKLVSARLRARSGAFVAPTLKAIGAVGDQRPRQGDLSLPTVYSPAPGAYPIAAEGYVLTFRDLCAHGLAHPVSVGVRSLLGYLLGPGQQIAQQLSFAPLPPRLRRSARAELRRLNCWGNSI